MTDFILESDLLEPDFESLAESDLLEPLELIDTTNVDDTTATDDTTEGLKPKLTGEELEKLKKEIEQKVNFSSAAEGIAILKNPEKIINNIEHAFTEFKEKAGRNMTYSEMRYMMG